MNTTQWLTFKSILQQQARALSGLYRLLQATLFRLGCWSWKTALLSTEGWRSVLSEPQVNRARKSLNVSATLRCSSGEQSIGFPPLVDLVPASLTPGVGKMHPVALVFDILFILLLRLSQPRKSIAYRKRMELCLAEANFPLSLKLISGTEGKICEEDASAAHTEGVLCMICYTLFCYSRRDTVYFDIFVSF